MSAATMDNTSFISESLSLEHEGSSGIDGLNFLCDQTETELSLTLNLKDKEEQESKSYDISFTKSCAYILIKDKKKHTINFFKTIQKDKSRVFLKNGNIIIQVVKEKPEIWPQVEINNKKLDCVVSDLSQGDSEKPSEEVQEKDATLEKLANENLTQETESKAEELIYHLELPKHDFFEKEMNLIVQVYVKSLNKDAVNIQFNSQGFVLKFHTEDAKFLKIYEGTSSDTTFSWSVKTKEKLDPEKSTINVKTNVIEINIRKYHASRWATLEAPCRKEANMSTKDNSWMPIKQSSCTTTRTNQPVPSQSYTNVNSNSEVAKNKFNIAFDDLEDVSVRSKSASASVAHRIGEDGRPNLSSIGQDLNVQLKPTAKVHPLSTNQEPETQLVPSGFTGLVNLGNTCFMNCVIQVLSNTREFRDYFLDGRYKNEINEDNPLGMKGQLAVTYGNLLRSLWSTKKFCCEPRRLKELISRKNPQFFGFAQHDAHEFLAFLLDGLHEDLNRIRKKPYIETVDSSGRPDEDVAQEAWGQHKQRNDSVVVDMFQGQYKSKLVCPKCGKVSITFDPFLYLSVPLPKKKKVIPVTFMWKEPYKKPVKFQLQVSADSSLESLTQDLSQRTYVKSKDIRVFEAHKGKIHKHFYTGSSLANIEPSDIIIACEILSEDLAGEEVYEIPVMQRTLAPTEYPTKCAFCHKTYSEGLTLKRCTKCYKVGYCDHTCQRNNWQIHKNHCSTMPDPIGSPFIISVAKSQATYRNLVQKMEEYARFSVNVFQPPVKSADTTKGSNPSAQTQSNLSSSLSQSCSSLNSLDSLSSASSTATLTGDQSDPQTFVDATEEVSSTTNSVFLAPTDPDNAQCNRSESVDNLKPNGSDSGVESSTSKVSVKSVSQVMGRQTTETERDKAIPTFFIKPVTEDGIGIKAAERLEDRGNEPLLLVNKRYLSMDWRNNEKFPSYVLVQSKELEAEEKDNVNIVYNRSNKPSLTECIELFTEPEILSPEEAWYCPSCKKHVEATKQMSIWRLPQTLIIQLKRFSFQNFLMRSKIKKHIDFPTRGLDLSKFCVGLKPGDSAPIYDLYGVANHHGLLIGGHYTSYARCWDSDRGADDVGWRLCDDSRVSSVTNEKSVVTADAYLLFYRRRGTAAIINSPQVATAPPSSPLIEDQPIFPKCVHDMNTNYVYHNSDKSPSFITEGLGLDDLKDIPVVKKPPPSFYSQERLSDSDTEAVDEKCDEEKRVDDVNDEDGKNKLEVIDNEENDEKRKSSLEIIDNKDDEDDDDKDQLVIDESTELGYTDMEAVD